ncbi:MAG: hypothetical protein U1U88_000986 [Lawsonella clevelandensis]
MENVGYMSRAAYLMDRVMASAGLEGRAFVALLSSVACAVPALWPPAPCRPPRTASPPSWPHPS